MLKCRGKVKWFNSEKGFGFLTRDGHPEDMESNKGVFVHYDSIEKIEGLDKKTLVKDQLVDFFAVSSEKGLKALRVTFVDVVEEENDA